MTREDLNKLIKLAEDHGLVYLHDEKGQLRAVVLKRDGWWYDQLPDVPDEADPHFEEAFSHTHFPYDEGELD